MRHPLFVLGLAVLATAPAARADDIDACGEAYTRAQTLRKDGKLLGSREALRICARPECPGFIAKECATWLDQVQATIPSVVAAATDDSGADLVGATVSIDGAAAGAKVDGRAIELDPGVHTFAFTTADGRTQETKVIVAEGKKDKRVAVRFTSATPAVATPEPAAPSAQSEPAAPEGKGRTANPWKTIGLVVAGVGVVGLGIGSYFGFQAISDESNANCPGNVCHPNGNPGELRSAESAANVSTGFFVAGAVLAAAGVATWVLVPATRETTARLKATPLAMASGGGVLLGGSW